MLLLLEPPAPSERAPAGAGGPSSLTREWLLAQVPLRKVGLAISRALKKAGHAPILEGLLRKGYLVSEDVGIVDVDVELGSFHTHEMEPGRYYIEATYTGVVDVDVKLRFDRYDQFADYKAKSIELDIDVLAEIDVEDGRVAGFEVMSAEVF